MGVATLLGCAESEMTAPAGEAVVPPVTPVAEREPDVSSASVEAPADEHANDQSPAAPAEAVAPPPVDSAAAYEPPFPDRVDLFVAPKRQGGAGGNQDSSDRAVELMGFVRVDRPRAILAINGETSALAVGESAGGIEVISVQPPSVVLSRGRQRWQATIE